MDQMFNEYEYMSRSSRQGRERGERLLFVAVLFGGMRRQARRALVLLSGSPNPK